MVAVSLKFEVLGLKLCIVNHSSFFLIIVNLKRLKKIQKIEH